jgi:S-DNA-T family DNA segregation ATPase FtsK/SpoIIIE
MAGKPASLALEHPIDTDDRAVPAGVRRFLVNRLFEIAGIGLFVVLILAGVALATWSVTDPSFNHSTGAAARNWLGLPGAILADELMQFLGLGVLALVGLPMFWAARLTAHRTVARPFRAMAHWLLASLAASAALSALPPPSTWALASGLGGNAGDVIHGTLRLVLSLVFLGSWATIVAAALALALALWSATRALGWQSDLVPPRKPLPVLATLRWLWRAFLALVRRLAGWVVDWRQARAARRAAAPQASHPDILTRLAPTRGGRPVAPGARIEPVFSPRQAVLADPPDDEDDDDESEFDADEEDGEEEIEAAEAPVQRVRRNARPIKPGKRLRKDLAPGFRFGGSDEFELPALTLLAEPRRLGKAAEISDEALEQNARMLEGVLEDFGVKGQIIKVRPGPVVTLYELEPAPGIKSSRVISLADDIARSMSAVSARVAVVPGRNAIGIELPNARRETVFLRELLASEAFEKTGQNLALALGKNIGGEPIFADLARMPHLLIAGTTGSGKSVGINTMVLSLLYRLPPDRCKLIMIDPKMLELSVYEGIPHLLAPVVTDPRKAVVALKWAVREMEERYRKMSKLGVRNIDGYNARMKQAQSKGEQLHRTVQTGFDPETGEPVFEKERMELDPMPYIVVIIDEMADLMMVAGKDIEGAVQRLAQMARAAGLHVVMATQRPSVDVITGTIKANFPTRISFQVTSKIDSRTILGEQGAEQLLGQGDMLYMAGGGRISRLHAPFVSDDEVEKIVAFLKSQGTPEYVEAVTEEDEDAGYGEPGAMGEGGGSGDALYDQAVAVVLRDKKVSTSYVQRRLQVGYNKAASLIERMEKEGLISAANATGKREILVPGDSARA